MAGGTIFTLAAAGLVATLSASSELRVAGGHIHAADIAELRGAGAQAAGRIIVARLPQGTIRTLSRVELVGLIHRAIPAVQVLGNLRGNVVFRSVATRAARATSRPYVAERPVVERGDKLTLISAAGAIVIQRPVIALQAATTKDKRLFVKTTDGAVLSVPFAGSPK